MRRVERSEVFNCLITFWACAIMKYRFAICSDTHGYAPPLFAESRSEALLHAGDIYHAPDLRNPANNLHTLQEWIKRINLPVYAVRGNHDFLDPANFFATFGDLTGHVKVPHPTSLSPDSASPTQLRRSPHQLQPSRRHRTHPHGGP